MKGEKFLKQIIAVLVLINVATLSYMWLKNGDRRGRGEGALEYLTNELQLSDEQQKQFSVLRKEHNEEHKHYRQKGKQLHDDFFASLKVDDSALTEKIADSISVFQKQLELSTFYHFKKIRALCTEDQKKKFDSLIQETMKKMAPPPPGHMGPPKDRE